MAEPYSYDIAIIGGGLAGLSLAAQLSDDLFSSLSIVIIEPRTHYERDKTWSYWRAQAHEYSEFEAATWAAWRLTTAEDSVVVRQHLAENFCYASISSDTFYQATLSKINACKHIQLMQSEIVENLIIEDGHTIIALKSDLKIRIKQVIFDSRLRAKQKPKANKLQLNQHFLGLEVTSDLELFDDDCIDLMDFQLSNHGMHFLYVLPYTKSRALVESTWICTHFHHDDYMHELNCYLAKRWPNAQFKIAYAETGCLPLSNITAHEYRLGKVQIIPIGTAAGTMRAATGYAFLETLSDSKRLARLLSTKKRLTVFKRHKIDILMDSLFLSLLAKNASFGPHYFMQMFSNCAPASLIRFLSGQANWRDRLNVVLSIPPAPMLKHLLGLKSH